MRYLTGLFFAFLVVSCSQGDKKREDFPNETQKKEKEYERHMERVQDTVTTGDSAVSRP